MTIQLSTVMTVLVPILDPKNSNKKDVESILFSFDLIIRTKLTKTSYNLPTKIRLIKFLKEERGIGYRRISHILTEKGYRSVRTNSTLKTIISIQFIRKVRLEKIELIESLIVKLVILK